MRGRALVRKHTLQTAVTGSRNRPTFRCGCTERNLRRELPRLQLLLLLNWRTLRARSCRPSRLVLGGRPHHFVELLPILPQYLAPHVLRTVRQPAADAIVHLISIQRGRMRKVRLKEDIIYPYLVDQPPWRRLL